MVCVLILFFFHELLLTFTAYRSNEKANLPRGLRVPIYSSCSEGAPVTVQIQYDQRLEGEGTE